MIIVVVVLAMIVSRHVELDIFVNKEGDTSRRYDSDEVWDETRARSVSCPRLACQVKHLPSVEAGIAFFLEHLPDNVSGILVLFAGVVDLQSCTDDLVWVCDGAGKHFADSTQQQKIRVRETVFAASCDSPLVFELLVRHELDSPMRDADEGRRESAVEALETFRLPQLARTVPYRSVRTGRVGAGR